MSNQTIFSLPFWCLFWTLGMIGEKNTKYNGWVLQIQPLQGANFPSRWVYHGTIYHIAIRAPKGIKFPTHGRINYTIPRLNWEGKTQLIPEKKISLTIRGMTCLTIQTRARYQTLKIGSENLISHKYIINDITNTAITSDFRHHSHSVISRTSGEDVNRSSS